jgi:hypothetical protein
MRLIPTHCQTCSRTALAEASSITEGMAVCAECGGPARSLPGESYNAGDETLFNELGATLREAGISPVNACQLSGELEIRKYGQPGRALKRLVQILPSLGLLELIVANRPAAMRKAEGMLATLLEAIAAGRSQSGIMPAVQPPSRKTSTG